MYLKYFTFLLCAAFALGLAIDRKSPEDMVNELKEKCLKVADENAFNEALQAVEDFSKCRTELINLNTLDGELINAKNTVRLNDVLKKNCNKKPQLDTCVDNLLLATKKCLNDKEKSQANIFKNITIQVGDYLCYNDGSRFASFINDDGLECVGTKARDMMSCLSAPVDMSSAYTPEHCTKVDEMIKCVVDQFKGCDRPGPAVFVGSLFTTMRDATPCRKN